MKTLLILLCACLTVAPTLLLAQDETEEEAKESFWGRSGIDFSTSFVMGIPQSDFYDNMDQRILPGFNFDLAFSPSRNAQFWKIGAQFEALFSKRENTDWDGIEIRTNSSFMSVNIINRLLPTHPMAVKPFAEFAIGLNLNYTSSTYDLYDKASFWEVLLLGAEDETTTISLNDHNDVDKNFAAGAGVIIKNVVVLQVKYNYVPHEVYVNPENISFHNETIEYDYKSSPVHMISVSLGFTFNSAKLVNFER